MTAVSMSGEMRPEHDCADDRVLLHYQRSYPQPVLEVWTAATEPRRLVHWFGTVTGSGSERIVHPPHDGPVSVPLNVRIERCVAPHELRARIDTALLELRLNQVGVVTTLELVRRHVPSARAAAIGPRWQFLLDRFTAYLERRPVPDWPAYPDLAPEYR
ncbi:SRPBCC domain-containing protein [Nocardia paucivorans]|uniref:SRPBCC domain-containing protein n=1 Tax=Nocardia paucivorans TaxID=114259 RepID=UPI00031010A4|nr:SRPBCC domain-containing protein [Nocardia paucivorans]